MTDDAPTPIPTLDSILVERRRMEQAGVDVATTAPDPIAQFERWYGEVIAAGINQPDGMALATVDAEHRPEVRHVLLKGVDERGFAFFTNYESTKARQIAGNPNVGVVFPWLQVNRQVRMTALATRLGRAESDDYWRTRPRGSQIGAWASAQSEVIADRAALEDRAAELEAEHAGAEIPRPDHWGGYLLVPLTVEFWQGRADRLHDRVRYRRGFETGWIRERLAP